MKRILFLLLALLSFSPAAHAQQGDTLEWLPVGTEWVYSPYSRNSQQFELDYIRYKVEADTMYQGRSAKLIQHRSLELTQSLMIARSNDSIWAAWYNDLGTLPRWTDWQLYFSLHSQPGNLVNLTVTYGDPLDTTFGDRFLLNVIGQGDTLINGYQLPYLLVAAKNPQEFIQDFRCRSYIQDSAGDSTNSFRLYRDLISTIGLLPEDGNSSEFYWLGCGLRCFTHPQLGTLRFDSPEMQAQHPDNCYYGSLVSRSTRARPPLDLGVWPNPSTGQLTLALEADAAGPLALDWYDAQGRRLLTETYPLHAGRNEIEIDRSSWPAGLYLWRARRGGQHTQGKLMLHTN